MSLCEVLNSEEPRHAPRLHKSTKHLKELYEIIAEKYAEVERAVFSGYSWFQITDALEKDCGDKWSENWNMTDIKAMFGFVKREKEIKEWW